jgi:2-C-methyl-D-erythritol 4-phosphate cytidylyltransferase
MHSVAILLAAGGSTRMGFPKLHALLNEEPVIAHTIRAFENASCISHIVLVTREQDIDWLQEICDKNGFLKVCAICEGGNSRQQSAANGLQHVPGNTDVVLVHDGARPLVTPAIIEKVVGAVREHGGAAAAVPVKDTIKVTDANGFIQYSPDRSALYQVQTPQGFLLPLYQEALKTALDTGKEYTDDCQLFESTGRPVKLVDGSYENLKITTPEDLKIAAALLGE